MNFTITKNESFNSNEIYFDGIPSKTIRENLKAIGFRWHGVKKCWYGFKSEDEISAAIDGKTAKKKATEVVNEYGVKVGDVFCMSWGYDQTNNDFFQVVAVTAKKARIVEVVPQCERDYITCMSANLKLTYKEGDMLPRSERPMWIKDNEKGDLKTIKDFSKDHNNPWIIVDSRSYSFTASRCHAGDTLYESSYA